MIPLFSHERHSCSAMKTTTTTLPPSQGALHYWYLCPLLVLVLLFCAAVHVEAAFYKDVFPPLPWAVDRREFFAFEAAASSSSSLSSFSSQSSTLAAAASSASSPASDHAVSSKDGSPTTSESATSGRQSSSSPQSSSSSDSNASSTESGIVWVIVVDLSRTVMTEASLAEALTSYLHNTSTSAAIPKFYSRSPVILNTNGSLLTALTKLTAQLESPGAFPDVIFLAETADVSASVVDTLRQNTTTADILIVSAHSANKQLCDPDLNAKTMCMLPRDMMNVRGLLEVVSAQLQWYSTALALSNSGYGSGVQSTIDSQVEAALSTPTVVAEVYMNPSATTASDDTALSEMLHYRPRGIACFLRETELLRLRQAVQRRSASGSSSTNSSAFLIGSREGLNLLSTMTGDGSASGAPWGALFVPSYTPASELIEQKFFPTMSQYVDEYAAFVLSYLLDGLRMVVEAGGTSNITALRAVSFTGYTGTVAFDSIYYQRVKTVFSLITADHPIRRPLVTWSLNNYSSNAIQVNSDEKTTAALIPTSPLRAVKVCMTAMPGCAPLAHLNAMLFVLMQYNAQNAANSSGISFLPVAISSGSSGVAGLATLIPIARTCTVVTGPGSDTVVAALTPVIDEYKIPQIDYGTSNDYFTKTTYSFPYYSRSIPMDSFSDEATCQLCLHYGWERVILLTTNDIYGTTRASSMSALLVTNNLYVEKIYYLDDTTNATVASYMNTIYEKLVSRIIIILVPFGTTDAAHFLQLPKYLTFLSKYVFFFDRSLCEYNAVTASTPRDNYQSSICIYPYVPATRLAALNTNYTNYAGSDLRQEMRTLMSDGGFISSVESCNLTSITDMSGFAVDAAYLLIDVATRAYQNGRSFNVSSNLLPFIRNATIDKFTGNFSMTSVGNRNFAAFSFDIQIPGSALYLGSWNMEASPSLSITTTNFRWLNSSTEVPLDTFRDSTFVLGSALSASPGAIVISVLGFVGTITVFYFCYRHYRMQKLIEQALTSNEFPITEAELRRLRGVKEEL